MTQLAVPTTEGKALKTFPLVYAIAALAGSLTLTNSDGSPYTGPAITDQSFTVTISTPTSDGVAYPRTNYTVNVDLGTLDLTPLGVDSNTWSSNGPTPDAASDLAEAQLNKIFTDLNMAPYLTYPSGMQGSAGGFLSFSDFETKYGLPPGTSSGTASPPPGGGSVGAG
jgi:hypothetical protein